MEKAREMVIYVWLVASGLYSLSYGQTVEFNYHSECYKESDTMTVTAKYTPSVGVTVDFVKWYYSGQVATNLLIDVSTCTVFGSVPAGYPVSTRMSYDCPSINANLNANTFKLSLTKLTEDELDDSWGATVTLSAGTDPSVVQKQISECAPTSATTSITNTSASTMSTSASVTTSTTTNSAGRTKLSKSKSVLIGAGVGGGLLVLLFICIIIICCLKRKNQRQKDQKTKSENSDKQKNTILNQSVNRNAAVTNGNDSVQMKNMTTSCVN